MRLGIKGKQVLGVTSIVGVVVVVVSLLHLSQIAAVYLAESKAHAELLADTIFHRAREIVRDGADSAATQSALSRDEGLRAILEASLYSNIVTYAAVADLQDRALAHSDSVLEGRQLPSSVDLDAVVARPAFSQLITVFSNQGRTLEFRRPLLLGTKEFGSIRVGVATLLVRNSLLKSLQPAVATALIALGAAVFGAMVLAQLLLRPIHVIKSGLSRLGRGELGVRLDLDQADEFGELGSFFNSVSAQISADRSHMAGQVASLESAVEHLEDAVALVSPAGELLFMNPAMRALVPSASVGASLRDLVPADHPLLRLADDTVVSGQSHGPVQAVLPAPPGGEAGERLMMSHPVRGRNGDLLGIMLVARNLEYLSQVQSTIRYSRKLAALGRLSAGVAHEVKNPLNAMMIHLELLRHQFSGAAAVTGPPGRGGGGSVAVAPPVDAAEALEHVDVIAGEIRRLDSVVQEFLKFSRPEDLRLQPVRLSDLFDEILPILKTEADRSGVQVVIESENAPDVHGDPTMLRQAFLNLALNACQAMPSGGTLTIRCSSARGRRVLISVIDTGIGIRPEHLQRIFDLYFTTKEKGSGIGLSMVYRTVQMHDGEIEVQSTLGAGTTFRVLLPQA